VVQAAAAVAWALQAAGNSETRLTYALAECNSMGLALFEEKSLDGAQQALKDNQGATLIVLENDLYRRTGAERVDEMFASVKRVIVLDSFENETTARADLVLPAATYAESDGTFVNNEGRAQRFFQVFVPEEGDIRESWRWISEMMDLRQHELSGQWHNLDDVLQALASQLPLFAPVLEIAPPEEFRLVEQKIPRQPQRWSGRTAIHANVNVSEPKPPADPDAPLAFSMEGYKGRPPASLIPRYWAPGWNSVQALNKFQQEVGGLLIGGSPGRRLIESSVDGKVTYFREFPGLFALRENEHIALPLYHIFGSEELSSLSPPILERAPEPYLALSSAVAEKLGIGAGELVQIDVLGRSLRLPAHLMDSLPENAVGLPAGLPGIPVGLPALSKIRRVESGEAGGQS
jgi:NADH-quinone oxidoreductase subunit G